jgi:hypothetical protein
MSATVSASESVEALNQVLTYLVSERQLLRAHGASDIELEANRKAIVAMQWRLNRQLGDDHRRVDFTAEDA